MTVQAVIDNLNSVIATVPGLARVYADPPESISEFPCAITYIREGEMYDSAAGGYSLHTLVVEIYQARQIMALAIDKAKVWPDLVRSVLRANQTLNGSISHFVWPLRYQALPLPYNDQVHFGVRFLVQVKVNET